MHTDFILQQYYYDHGLFNLSVHLNHLFGKHDAEVKIYTSDIINPIVGKLYIKNEPHQPRVRGGNQLKIWFQNNCQVGDTIKVSIINPVTFWVYE